MPAVTLTDEFLHLVRKSTLLDGPTIDEFVRKLQAAGVNAEQPAEVARELIHAGLLTQFQARLLLAGRYQGFVANSKYKFLDLIGVGGMGRIYLCEHIMMHRLVALKMLAAEHTKAPGSLERFYREARAIASLDHPNIVRAHDVDRHGNNHFLIMEYVDGANLMTLVERHGPLSVPRACHYIHQAALGLQHAHQGGWVHRDVKPSNILLSRQGLIKVLDLGLARLFQDRVTNLTQEVDNKNVLGTADYIAPEQAMNCSDVDIRADIYSLGATFYFLLTGRPPFPDGSVAQKLIWHQMRQPSPLQTIRRDVPHELAVFIAKMMAKDPNQRFQTPIDVAAALSPWIAMPIGPPAETEMPAHSPVIARFLAADNSRPTLSSSATHTLMPAQPQSITPAGPRKSDSSGGAAASTTMQSWRGRTIADLIPPTMESHSAPQLATPSGIQQMDGWLARHWGLIAALIVCVTIGVLALGAYQSNQPVSGLTESKR